MQVPLYGRSVTNRDRGSVTWQIVLYALLALTAVRVLPVVAALLRTDVVPRDRFVLGCIGPRGVATLVFGMLAFIELPASEADLALTVTVVAVVASVVVHGVSAGLVTRMYGAEGSVADGPVVDTPAAGREHKGSGPVRRPAGGEATSADGLS